jgi:hypothetical protein
MIWKGAALHRTSFRATVTVAILALLLLSIPGRQKNWPSHVSSLFKPSPPATPEDRVYKMLDAARVGDANKYLDCFSGKMRDQLLRVVKETSLLAQRRRRLEDLQSCRF